MGIYRGRVNCRQLAIVLDTAMKAEGWIEVSSDFVNDGRVYRTTGTSTKNPFVINIKDPIHNYLIIGVYEKYTPASAGIAGVFENGYEENIINWNLSYNNSRYDVNYIFNITKDRVILYTEGQKAESKWCNSIVYAGLPKLYDVNDIGPNAAGLAWIGRGSTATEGFKVLKNRKLDPLFRYSWDYYNLARSFGWGKRLFFSPLYIYAANEGMRGELDGLYWAEKTDFEQEMRPLDEFTQDGKKYILLDPANRYNDNRSLPLSGMYLMEV